MNPARSRVTALDKVNDPAFRIKWRHFLLTSEGGALRTDLTAWGHYIQSQKSEVSLYRRSWIVSAFNFFKSTAGIEKCFSLICDSKSVPFSSFERRFCSKTIIRGYSRTLSWFKVGKHQHSISRAQFNIACKHTRNLLSTEKSCLIETGYQPQFYKVYIVVTGAPLIAHSKQNLLSNIFFLT